MTKQGPLPVPFSYQSELYNCGPHTLQLVMQFLGTDVEESKLREYGKTTVEGGTTCDNMTHAARLAQFWAYGSYQGTIADLAQYYTLGFPVIVHLFNPEWPDFGYGDVDRSHYVIVTGVYDSYVTLHDTAQPEPGYPSGPHMRLPIDEFLKLWSDSDGRGEDHWFLVLAKKQLDEHFLGPLPSND